MKRKVISALALSLILTGLSACGDNTEPAEAEISSESYAAVETEELTSAEEGSLSEETTAEESTAETSEQTEASADSVSEETTVEDTAEESTAETSEQTTEASEETDASVEEASTVTRRDEWVGKIKNFVKTKLVADENGETFFYIFSPPSYYRTEIRLDDYTFDGIPEIVFVQAGDDGYCCYRIFDLDSELIGEYLGNYNYDTKEFSEKYCIYTNNETGEKVMMLISERDFMCYKGVEYYSLQENMEFFKGYDESEDLYYANLWNGAAGIGEDVTRLESAEGKEESQALMDKFLSNYTEISEYPSSGAVWQFTDDAMDFSDDALSESLANELVDKYMSFLGE